MLLGDAIQACNDPKKWPFAAIAKQAAAWHPDLVIHVGDYLYREIPCPSGDKACKETPYGDNWLSWQADFFKPAQPLLKAAPWIMLRGNHEDCKRAGIGWNLLLNPYGYSPNCPIISPPYSVATAGLNFFIIDSSAAKDDASSNHKLVKLFKNQLAGIRELSADNVWLLSHKPIWSFRVSPTTQKTTESTLSLAMRNLSLPQLKLIFAGHIHTFTALNFKNHPPQVVVGNSGTALINEHELPLNFNHLTIGQAKVINGFAMHNFGYLALERKKHNWQGKLYGRNGQALAKCQLQANQFLCNPIQ